MKLYFQFHYLSLLTPAKVEKAKNEQRMLNLKQINNKKN